MKMNFDTSGSTGKPGERKVYDLIPEGEYLVKVLAETAKTYDGGKEQASLTLEVQEGPHRGRRLWDNFLLKGYSPMAHQISKERWEELSRVAGGLEDSADAVGHLVTAVVFIDEYNGRRSNRVRRYEPAAAQGEADEPLPF